MKGARADIIEMFNGFDWFGNILEVREVSLLPTVICAKR